MSEVKLKTNVRFKAYGKCNEQDNQPGNKVVTSIQPKVAYKDYMDEFFAGLIWLG